MLIIAKNQLRHKQALINNVVIIQIIYINYSNSVIIKTISLLGLTMKKSFSIAVLLALLTFNVNALTPENKYLLKKSEELFDCSELVDEAFSEKFEDIKNSILENKSFVKLFEKEQKGVSFTPEEQIEFLQFKKAFYQSSYEINEVFVRDSIDCMKKVFPKFPNLELNKE